MKKWKKIIIDKSNKITKQNNVKNFNDYSQEMDGYYSNDNYKSKDLFFKKYLKDRYLTLDKYLTENLNINKRNLSIASGRAINELSLISNKFNITCSDLQVPSCYEDSQKIFGNFDYIKFNILKDKINKKFDNIFALSSFYIFSSLELEEILNNINQIINKDGTLILEFPGSEDNFFSFIFNEIYLVLESYLAYAISKIFKKKIGINFDNNFGFKRKNKEIIKLVEKFGFSIISIHEYDYLTEIKRSLLANKIINYLPFTTTFFKLVSSNIPYIRMFKFKKI